MLFSSHCTIFLHLKVLWWIRTTYKKVWILTSNSVYLKIVYTVSFCDFFWKKIFFKKRACNYWTKNTAHLIDVNINNLRESKVCSKVMTLNDIVSQFFWLSFRPLDVLLHICHHVIFCHLCSTWSYTYQRNFRSLQSSEKKISSSSNGYLSIWYADEIKTKSNFDL